MKIAHLGDVHFRSLSRHEEYKKSFLDAFSKMRDLKPDVILVAGDIVHSKTQGISPELISVLTWWFREMASIAEVRVTLGNHDGLILNPDREDAVSPIVEALNDPRIKLHKQSGVYPLNETHNLCVFSCFDEKGWESVRPESGKINIATFHGSVHGAETDENWKLESSTSVEFFKSFDYVMLGDIHKQQFLTDRIAFCGSTIQQNYGELPNKGFLFWDIDGRKFNVKHVEVAHESPFVTISYDGDIDSLLSKVENYPKNSRFRIKVDANSTQADVIQIKSAIKSIAKPEEIVFRREENELSNEISDENFSEMEGIDSVETVDALIKEYYQQSNLTAKLQSDMSSAVVAAWNASDLQKSVCSGRWSIKKLEFDNIFGYGEGNVINLEAAQGITGIFGKNRSGKSSVCGALTYALFNGTDRGPMKSLHVVNVRKNFCRAKVIVSKKGKNFLVERQTNKRANNKGDVNATTYLNMFECDDNGAQVKDLSDEQRRETEKVLREQIGNLDDFLLSSFASQGDVNRFLGHGSSARKHILARFLRLDILDSLHDHVKQELSVAKGMLGKVPAKEFDSQILDKDLKLKARTSEREVEIEAAEKISEILNSLKVSLASQGEVEKYTKMELEDQRNKVKNLRLALEENRRKLEISLIKKSDLSHVLENLLEESSGMNLQDLVNSKNQLVDAEKSLLIAKGDLEAKSTSLNVAKKEVMKLSDVPCGDSFPTCKYIVSAKKAEKSMLEKQEALESAKKYADSLRGEISKLMRENIDEKLSKKKDLDEKILHIKRDISENGMEIFQLETKISSMESNLQAAILLEDKMRLNLCDDETTKAREILLKKKQLAEEKLAESKKKIQTLSEKIGLHSSEIVQLQKDKKSYEEYSSKVQVYTLLQRALCKDGIPLQIIKKKLPIINHEISHILQGIVGFTVELEADKNDGMEVMLNYGDSRRIIECGSGMEKMVASLAIRTALVRISSLPKSDMLIIDEGFGALDPTNIEACTRLLRSLTKTFRTILIISHVDSVKDIVDNVIEISVDYGHNSKVEFL